jgi:hypothetical protein
MPEEPNMVKSMLGSGDPPLRIYVTLNVSGITPTGSRAPPAPIHHPDPAINPVPIYEGQPPGDLQLHSDEHYGEAQHVLWEVSVWAGGGELPVGRFLGTCSTTL